MSPMLQFFSQMTNKMPMMQGKKQQKGAKVFRAVFAKKTNVSYTRANKDYVVLSVDDFLSNNKMFYTRFVTIMCYYGLTSAAATLSSDVYSNFQYAMVAEVTLACLL